MSMRTVAALALLLAALASAIATLVSAPADLALTGYVLGWVIFGLVGAILVARRPGSPIGWLFLVIAAVGDGALLASAGGPVDPAGGTGALLRLAAMECWVVPFALLPILLMLFPTGRPPTRRWWIPIGFALLATPVGVLTTTDDNGTSVASLLLGPAGAALADDTQIVLTLGVLIGLQFVAAASLFRRRRSASAVERQQLKWVAYAGAILAIALLGTSIAFVTPLRQLDPEAPFPIAMFGGIPFVAGLISIPIAVGIAVLRYRLYEIDALINRTVVYGSLTAILIAAYVGAVAAFQFVLSPFTSGSPIAVAASTLAVVGLFQPLRRRIQFAVDRRFYRRRYDAERTLDAFASRLRDEIDLRAVEGELLAVVDETLQPARASVWLRR